MKQTRKTVTTTYSSSSGGSASAEGEASASSASFSSSSSRRSGIGRPPSPARISRVEEQEALQGLNDRLAAYIDKVRSLEAENSRLSMQVRSTEEIVKREVTSVKTLFESELAELRKLLDDTSKEKARLQIEANKYKTDYDDLLAKYTKRDRDASALERRVSVLERQLADFQARDWEKENLNLKNELDRLEKQLAAAKKQLEEETLQRVDLQNRVKTLKEDLHFKSQVYEQELEESRVRTTTQMEEVDSRVEQEYETRLQDALREIRAQHDYDLQSVKVELEGLYENKMEDLRKQLERSSASSEGTWEELMVSRRSVDELTAELGKLKSENAGLEIRVRDLDIQLERERSDFRLRLRSKDDELAALRVQLEDLERDFAAILEIKIKLDRELEAYRKLLESEETRLNISASMSQSTNMSQSASSSGRKRKRMDIGQAVEEYTQRTASSGFSRSASSSCGLDIVEVDTDGKFVKLENTTSKDQSLGKWVLKHVSGDNETRHKFHNNVLKAGQSVTVWSSDSDTTHNPPTDLVMKGKRWFASGDMSTVLIDDEDKEVATCTMTKSIGSVSTFSRSSRGVAGDELDGSELQDKDKCSIM